MEETLIKTVQYNLLNHLPGLEAQMKMAPPVRSKSDAPPPNAKRGGVCILLFYEDLEWKILLMIRTDDGGTHSGQISLPGGSYDDSDCSITYTALRELEEEMGISMRDVKILGRLTDLYIPPSNFLVSPIVAISTTNLIIHPNKAEVKEVIKLPVTNLLKKQNKTERQVQRSDVKSIGINVPVYAIDDTNFIWGATAMILSEFEACLIE